MMVHTQKRFKFRLLLTIFAGLLLAGSSYFFYTWRTQGPIYDFVYDRDAQVIKELFSKNVYWLTTNPDQDIDFTLRNRTLPSDDLSTAGMLTIKVLREHNLFGGFTAYYKKSPYLGVLLFLGVPQEIRSKGYGRKLIQYALEDLFSQGCLKVELVTRTSNIPAITLYKKVGFKEISRDDGFVYFEKKK